MGCRGCGIADYESYSNFAKTYNAGVEIEEQYATRKCCRFAVGFGTRPRRSIHTWCNMDGVGTDIITSYLIPGISSPTRRFI